MLKLYKKVEEEIHYWETWTSKNYAIVHWGIAGERGKNKKVETAPWVPFQDKVQKEIDKMLLEGYKQIDIDDHYTLLIEYKVDGMGTVEDIEKRHRLENRMNETLGWTGLGYCDGGSIGSGTMEVCCFVIDFEIAKNAIQQDLKDTEFSNYNKIYDENEE